MDGEDGEKEKGKEDEKKVVQVEGSKEDSSNCDESS